MVRLVPLQGPHGLWKPAKTNQESAKIVFFLFDLPLDKKCKLRFLNSKKQPYAFFIAMSPPFFPSLINERKMAPVFAPVPLVPITN